MHPQDFARRRVERLGPPGMQAQGTWPQGWQFHAMWTSQPTSTNTNRSLVLGHAPLSSRAAWLSAIPSEPSTTLIPQTMLLARSTPWGTTRYSLFGCWPDGQKWANEHSCARPGEAVVAEAKLCHNSGSPTRRPQACYQTTADASTWSCMGETEVGGRCKPRPP